MLTSMTSLQKPEPNPDLTFTGLTHQGGVTTTVLIQHFIHSFMMSSEVDLDVCLVTATLDQSGTLGRAHYLSLGSNLRPDKYL